MRYLLLFLFLPVMAFAQTYYKISPEGDTSYFNIKPVPMPLWSPLDDTLAWHVDLLYQGEIKFFDDAPIEPHTVFFHKTTFKKLVIFKDTVVFEKGFIIEDREIIHDGKGNLFLDDTKKVYYGDL